MPKEKDRWLLPEQHCITPRAKRVNARLKMRDIVIKQLVINRMIRNETKVDATGFGDEDAIVDC